MSDQLVELYQNNIEIINDNILEIYSDCCSEFIARLINYTNEFYNLDYTSQNKQFIETMNFLLDNADRYKREHLVEISNRRINSLESLKFYIIFMLMNLKRNHFEDHNLFNIIYALLVIVQNYLS